MKKILLVTLILIVSFGMFGQTTPEEMQKIIDERGFDWQAAWTPYSNMSADELRGLLGENDDFEDIVKPPPIPIPPPPDTLPTSFDWRNKSGNNYITEIKSQKLSPWGNPLECESDFSFATVAGLESRLLIDKNKPNANIDLAEQMMVGQCASCPFAGDCNGGNIYNASSFLISCGVAEEWCDPYQGVNESCSNACSDWTSHNFSLSSYGLVSTSISGIKNALMTNGPLVADMEMTADFINFYGSGVYCSTNCCMETDCTKCNNADYDCYPLSPCDQPNTTGISCILGRHAILIIGWEDDIYHQNWGGGYFIAKNSWGTGWGMEGFFNIAYSQRNNCVRFARNVLAYNGSSTKQPIYSIEGQIKDYYDNVNCCKTTTIKASKGSQQVQQTTADRKPGSLSFYRFLLPNGSYTLTALNPPTGYSFTPNPMSVTINGGDLTAQDFKLIGNYNISGKVTFNSTGLPNVSIKITGTKLPSAGLTFTTDSTGNFNIPYLGPGSYTIVPSRSGYTFNPSSASITIGSSNITQNFTAGHQITGTITRCGSPDVNVQVTATDSGGASKVTYTNSNGFYSFTALPNGTYTIAPHKPSSPPVPVVVFNPSSITVTLSGADVTGQNFVEFANNCTAPPLPRCSPSYFDSLKLCSSDNESCYSSAVEDFCSCLKLQTTNVESLLYGHVLLVVTLNREKGKPENQSFPFSVQEEGDFYINVINGDTQTKDTKVSSANISIEELGTIFKESNFNKNVNLLSNPVHLTSGDYTLNSILKSEPNSYITIIISTFDMKLWDNLP